MAIALLARGIKDLLLADYLRIILRCEAGGESICHEELVAKFLH